MYIIADFVTPLKKRRLVRESMSHDSVSNDSPAATPTPSVQVSAPFGYFSSLDTFETYKNKNGLNLFFSPVKPDDNELKFEVSVAYFTIASLEIKELLYHVS